MAKDARARSLWYLSPFKSSSKPQSESVRLDRLGIASHHAGAWKPPTLPLSKPVAAGTTIEIDWEFVSADGPQRCPRCGSTDFIQSPSAILCYRCGTKRPDRNARPERRSTWFYAPTDHELELMRGWGYDCNNPDWKRFANELGRQSLIAGRVLPNNWQSQREFRDLTASDLVNWMKSLRDGDDRERDDDDETAFVPSLQLRNDRDLNAVKCSRLIDKFGVESLKPVDGKIRFRKPSPGKLLIHAGDWYNYWADQEARQFAAMDDLPDYIAGARDREAKVQKRQRKPR